MAAFEAPAATVTTSLVITPGQVGYRSPKGDCSSGEAHGTLTPDDLGTYNIYEIKVDVDTTYVTITGGNDSGGVLQPWANGLTMSADAGTTVYTLLPEPSTEYSYSLVDANLAVLFSADIAALDIATL